MPAVSNATLLTPLKLAAVPCPSAEPAFAFPSHVVTFQFGAASGRGHHAQLTAPVLLESPGAHGQHATLPSPLAAVPIGHGQAGAGAPGDAGPGQKNPAAHAAHILSLVVKVPAAQTVKGDGDCVGVPVGESEAEVVPVGESVREPDTVREGVGLELGVRVPVGVSVHVGAPEGVPLSVGEGEPVGEPVDAGVPVGEAPMDIEAVGEGVTEAVLVVLSVPLAVREAVMEAVCELLGEDGGQMGGAPSSSRRMRLFMLSVIHSVVPATASPQGE